MQRKFPRWARIILRGILGLVALAVLLVATIQIEQRLFRCRAERLYQDMMAIHLRRTTFEQLEPMLQRWSVDVSHGEPCFKQHCDLTITIRPPIFALAWDSRFFQPVLNINRKLGGRFSTALARVSVRNGFVWGEDYVVGFEVAPFKDADGRMVSYYGEGRILTTPRVNPWRLMWPSMRENSEFKIELPNKCWGCVFVEFTPYADPKDVRQLSHFNFSCLTAWRPCRYREDVAPEAIAEHAIEGQRRETDQAGCDLASVRIVARDTENAAIFDVIANRKVAPDPFDYRRILTVRLVQRVKRTLFWSPGEKVEVEIADPMPALPPLELDNHVKPGERVILLFLHRSELNITPNSGAETCGVVPYSEENLDVVRAGAAEDDHVEPLIEYDPEYQPRTGSDLPGPPPPPAFIEPRL